MNPSTPTTTRLPAARTLPLILCGLALSFPLARAASGTWTSTTGGNWSDTANWSGGTVATGGSTSVNVTATFSASGTQTVNLDTNQTVQTLAFSTGTYTLSSGNGSVLTLAGSSTPVIASSGTISATLAGTQGFIMNPGGTRNLTLSGNNTYTGVTTMSNGGMIYVKSNNALGATGTGNGTTINYTTSSAVQLHFLNNVTSGEDITLQINSSGTTGANLLYNDSGNNTLTGNITLGRYSPSASLTAGVNTFGIQSTSGTMLVSGNITGATANGQADGSVADQSRLQLRPTAAAAVINISGVISDGTIGTGGLSVYTTSDSLGTVNLSGTNTYSGSTVIAGGTLKVGSTGAIPNGSGKGNVFLDGGTTAAGTLDLNGFDTSLNGLSGATNTVTGKIVNNATGTNKTLTVGNGNATGTSFAGVIADHTSGTGTVALTKTGSGTQTLSGANTYTGGTTINSGTLSVSGSLADSGAITVSGGTYAVAANDTVGAVTLASGTISGTGTLTGSSYAVQGGAISSALAGGGVALTKSTTATATLSGANTYTGGTTLNGGTLLINNTTGSGSGTGSVSIAATASLGGTGFVKPTGANGIGFAGTSIVAPGDLTGAGAPIVAGKTLTFDLGSTTGSAVFSSGSTISIDLDAAAVLPADVSEHLAFIGLTTGVSQVAFNGNVVNFSVTGGLLADGVYTLASFSADNAYTGQWVLGTGLEAYATAQLVQNANSIQLSIGAIPEPATAAALAGLAVLGCTVIARRRRRS